MIKNKIAAIGIIAAIGLSIFAASRPVPAPVQTVIESQPQSFGALTGPDIPSPYISWGDVQEYRARKSFATATNVPCAIQAPAATSTLMFVNFKITTATSTDATVWTVATSTLATATTTLVGSQFTLPAGTTAEYGVGAPNITITNPLLPNAWVVIGVQGTKPGSAANLNGSCSAGFRVI